ncbi:hypothetical protein CICLE_v10006921mg, partial [Citrus x clementina]
AYIMVGPYQPRLSKYPKYGPEKHPRRFQSSWFNSFPSWLEYSPIKDAAFCPPCYLFNTQSAHPKCDAYTINGFNGWRKVKDGKICAFLNHVGNDPNLTHKKAEKSSFTSNNEKIAEFILDKAPKYASYTSLNIQKEILHVLSMKVKKAICEEIRDAKFCLIVDKSRDESKKEQMVVVLRFIDKDGFVREHFFGLVHVSNTSVWNGLQTLILKDCPYAYYVHCLAQRPQLALIVVSHEIVPIHNFFTKLTSVVNIIGASCKGNDELKCAQATDIECMIFIDELKSERKLNQIGTLQRPRDTKWSFHFRSVSNLIKMLSATCSVLLNIIKDETNVFQRGDAIHLLSSTKALI